jgi:cell filamentation protein, protein adenylyltransferase
LDFFKMRTNTGSGRHGRADGLERVEAAVSQDAAALAPLAASWSAALEAAATALTLDEILSSTALAGVVMDKQEGVALLARGLAAGGRPLRDYESVADYASASRYVAEHGGLSARRPPTFIRVEEILDLHRRAMLRTGRAPGTWREHNAHAVKSGLVPPPYWLVTREIAAFVDRFVGGPPAEGSRLRWIAAAHARLLRVQPFGDGNGRVGRLVANLLLRRLGLPIAAFPGRLGARYPDALARADSGDLEPLAALFGEAVREALARFLAAARRDDPLVPLRRLVDARRLPAFIKAAQRGRLRVVRDGARLLSTCAWVAEYEASRPSAKETARSTREPPAP